MKFLFFKIKQFIRRIKRKFNSLYFNKFNIENNKIIYLKKPAHLSGFYVWDDNIEWKKEDNIGCIFDYKENKK